jgi:hypothetical protein
MPAGRNMTSPIFVTGQTRNPLSIKHRPNFSLKYTQKSSSHPVHPFSLSHRQHEICYYHSDVCQRPHFGRMRYGAPFCLYHRSQSDFHDRPETTLVVVLELGIQLTFSHP